MKREITAIILSIFSLNLTSAYAGFSPAAFFSGIDSSFLVYTLIFLIFFLVIDFAMMRVFKQKTTSKLIAFCISLLGVYGISMVGFDISNLLFNIGINEDNLAVILPALILFSLIVISIKKDRETGRRRFLWHRPFLILGSLFIILSMTSLIYEKVFSIILGAVLFLIGLILWRKWKLKFPKIKGDGGSGTNSPGDPNRSDGIKALTRAAQRFKKWALRQKNPKFVGSWAMFVNYLKRGNWGNSEADICKRLGISSNDFVRIFNRYGKV